MGLADWIALALIGFAVVCAVIYMIKSRKSGKGCWVALIRGAAVKNAIKTRRDNNGTETKLPA